MAISGTRGLAFTCAGFAMLGLGCPAFNHVDRNIDRTPVMNSGAGASIIYPGQTAPAQSSYPRITQSGSHSAPLPGVQGAEHSGHAPAPGGHLTMIGGTEVDEKRHQKIEESPIYWKYLTAPFAVVAAPFQYAYESIQGEPEPGPSVPTARERNPAPPPPEPVLDYETQQLEGMQRELARRQAAAPPTPAPSTPAWRGGLSIADELKALERAAEAPTPAPETPPTARVLPREPARVTPSPSATRPVPAPQAELVRASGHVDRNGDGVTDHWIFRDAGEISRELFDENFDGQPDRTLHYDPQSHRVVAVEEDSNHDGRIDSYAALRDGQVIRRRDDANADGAVDTWSFYRDGNLTRLERDASGDGFRDRISHYEAGLLLREEQDGNGDGLPDLITHYGKDERVVRVEEDADGDGTLDVVSHYQNGRLARRELLDAQLLESPEPH